MKIVVPSNQHSEPCWCPNTDMFVASTGELIVMLELAGLSRDDLNLSVDGSRLRVRGYRRPEEKANGGKYLVMEIAGGPFEAVLDIPAPYDLPNAIAGYEVGFLRVVVPRKCS